MRPLRLCAVLVGVLLVTGAMTGCSRNSSGSDNAGAGRVSNESGDPQLLRARAWDAALWGVPLVNTDAMRQAFLRDLHAQYNDVAFLPQPANWRFQTLTPNASTHYVLSFYNLKDGPVVLEVPPQEGAGLLGSIVNAWDEPVEDVGPDGADKGAGGKYLLIPPGYTGEVPEGLIAQRFTTVNGYLLFRSIANSPSAEDADKANALAKRVRLYPLAQAATPPEQRYIDMYDKTFEGLPVYDDTYFDSLARMVAEEPVQSRDLAAMGILSTLGIGKDETFAPDTDTRAVLKDVAGQAKEWLIEQAVNYSQPWWNDHRWSPPDSRGTQTGWTFVTPNEIQLDARALFSGSAFAPPKKTGSGSFYLLETKDADGKTFDGGRNYKLHVPPNVPAAQYWSIIAYDGTTNAFIRDSAVVGLDSYNQKMARNADGSVDIYFGPSAPAGQENNWIATKSGRDWYSMFRLYGPQQPLLDKTWSLDDIVAN